jgi:hypothetical protein
MHHAPMDRAVESEQRRGPLFLWLSGTASRQRRALCHFGPNTLPQSKWMLISLNRGSFSAHFALLVPWECLQIEWQAECTDFPEEGNLRSRQGGKHSIRKMFDETNIHLQVVSHRNINLCCISSHSTTPAYKTTHYGQP